MSRILGVSLAAVLLVGALAPRVDATCAVAPRVAKVLFPDAKVPAGGGLLVSLVAELGPNPKYDHMKLVDPSFKYRAGKRELAPVIETLAPGLAIYRVPEGITSAQLVAGTEVLGTVTVTPDAPAPLPAPKLKKLRQDSRSSRKGSTIQMWADLAAAAPEGAVALVVSDGKVARSFGFVPADPKNRVIQVYDHYPCGEDPEGTVMSTKGEKLQLYWLDRAGRKSPATTIKLEMKGSLAPSLKDE